MKGICYRLPEISDCELYCGAGFCPGNCIVKEMIDDDAVLMEGFVPVSLSDEEYMERAIQRYGKFSSEQLEEKAMYEADGKLDEFTHRFIMNGKIYHYDSGVDLHMIFAEEERKEDEAYADWCLQNNWLKLDERAACYVCGEDLMDEDWRRWIEIQLIS